MILLIPKIKVSLPPGRIKTGILTEILLIGAFIVINVDFF